MWLFAVVSSRPSVFGQRVGNLSNCEQLLRSIDEETEQFIKDQSIGNVEYKDLGLSVDRLAVDYRIDGGDDDGDIYAISSGEDIDFEVMEYAMSCGVDTNSKQNYVAYIMEQTEAHRVLEKWYYDINQDRDVAHLAQQIYKKYFNEPFQF